MESYKIAVVGGKAEIYTPYNPNFVSRIKTAFGRWDSANRCWTVPADAVEVARAIMREVYGRDDSEPEHGSLINVLLTFTEYVHESCGPVMVAGKILSSASGRNGGARSGEDVYYRKGKPFSGGSLKNWRSSIEEGSVVELHNVSPELLRDLPKGVTWEEIPATPAINLNALKAERERLVARIAEIDAIIGKV